MLVTNVRYLPLSASFTQKIPNLDLTIYEKEDGIGGTWYVNRYPVRERYMWTLGECHLS
jgi:hypothetical protein